VQQFILGPKPETEPEVGEAEGRHFRFPVPDRNWKYGGSALFLSNTMVLFSPHVAKLTVKYFTSSF